MTWKVWIRRKEWRFSWRAMTLLKKGGVKIQVEW